MKKSHLLVLVLLTFTLASCRSETQNRIRREIQDFTGQRFHITLYDQNGEAIYEGTVNGKISRSSGFSSNDNEEPANGDFIYWYDERGRYHQTNLPYLVTAFERTDD